MQNSFYFSYADSPVRGVAILSTGDRDIAESSMSDIYFPHRLDPLVPGSSFCLKSQTAIIGSTTIGLIKYDTDVRLDCGELESAYDVNIPLMGHTESVSGNDRVHSGPGIGTVYVPNRMTTIKRWSANCLQYGIKFEAKQIEDELERLLGRPVKRPLSLLSQLDMRSRPAANMLQVVRRMTNDMRGVDPILQETNIANHLSGALADTFLMAASIDYHKEAEIPDHPKQPRTVRRAIEAIESCPEQPWRAAQLAEVAGVGIRQLQLSFREYMGVSPIEYIRDVRLARVHAELLAPDSDVRISTVARRWGFTHLGRFSHEYRKNYGCRPSETLHKKTISI